jgi:osmotically inducible protein OsmC
MVMADIERSSQAVWHGDLREGNGKINTSSGVLKDTPYTYATRFENEAGTNPEELLAAAHAACYSMALANILSRKEHQVHHIETKATCYLTLHPEGGRRVSKMRLETRGKVDDIDEETFKTNAEEAKRTCPVSYAFAAIEVELDAKLI